MSTLPWLDPFDDTQPFPDPELALAEPDGLLAVGGNLSPQRLLSAYQIGVFPWYCDGQPILWWSPNPRTVLFPEKIKISRSLRKILRRGDFTVTADTAFDRVMQGCSAPRTNDSGTWISSEMRTAYYRLHRLGFAHSIECWIGQRLAGGLYGVSLGQIFFGESMFSLAANASKVALAYLCLHLQHWGFALIDCQMRTEHLISMGAEEIPRPAFRHYLASHCMIQDRDAPWQLERDIVLNHALVAPK